MDYGLWNLYLTLLKLEEAYVALGRRPAWIGDLVSPPDKATSLVGCEPTDIAVSLLKRSGEDFVAR